MSIRSFALTMLLLVAARSEAQVVEGRITDRQTAARVGGVVVLLLDPSDNPVARALSAGDGAYRLVAPGAGSYRIRTLRIGFRLSTSGVIELATGQEVTRDLEVAMIPFLLDTVKATGRNACRDRSGTDVAAVVWEQARTALYATQISSRLPAIGATLQTFERVYSPGSTRIREQSVGTRSGFTTAPWVTLSVDSLRRVGYVSEDNQGWFTFYGPDVNVLLSREFQADHCFRLSRSKDTTVVRVSFEPTREQAGISDIKGTVWLDTKTSDLLKLEYRYTNLAAAQEDEGAGGEMVFARLRNGGFAISHWSIRMPVVQRVFFSGRGGLGAPAGEQPRLTDVRVVGGDLVVVTVGDDTLWTRPRATLTGIVADSMSGARIGLAKVSLSGTSSATTADARGRFEIPDVLPGDYTLEVRTPSLDSMNAVHRSNVTVEVDAKPLSIRVVQAGDLARHLCSFDQRWSRTSPPGIIVGTTRLLGDSIPPRYVPVAAEWQQMKFRVEGGSPSGQRERQWKETRTDSKGEFRICGVPTGTLLKLSASGDSAESAPVEAMIPDGARFMRVELTFDRVVARSAVFAGTVFLDSTQQPIPDVEVSMPGLMRSMLTNATGRFRFPAVPAGEHQVVVRRIGYGPLDTTITFAPGQAQARRVYLSKVPQLEAVAVGASRLPPEFEENRRLGLGHFMTRLELAKVEHLPLPDVLEQIPGLKIDRKCGGPFTMYCVLTNRVVRTDAGPTADNPLAIMMGCPSTVYLDNTIVSRGGDPPFDVNRIHVDQIEAIQWYSSRLQLPAEYSLADNKCGALVIHTRKSP